MFTAIYAFAVQPLIDFAFQYKWPLLFYLAIILIVFLLKNKFEWQAPLVGLYKTQLGVKTMKRISEKHRELVKWLAYVGIGVGFAGMGFIVYILISGLFKLVFEPSAPPTLSLVIPGFNIAGTNIQIPLITGWLALFIVIAIHEFSHGVVSKAHGIPIKSSGFLIFGPILGAFVEPDEKKLLKAPDHVQYSMFAAGPFSNVLSWLFFSAILIFVGFLVMAMTVPMGVELASVDAEGPAGIAGLEAGMLITQSKGHVVQDTTEFLETLETLKAGETVSFVADGQNYEVLAGESEESGLSDKGRLGITFTSRREAAVSGALFDILLAVVRWLGELLKWVILLSLGLGLANLLPLGFVDGGQMMRRLLTRLYGDDKGLRKWKAITKAMVVIILILLLVPFVKGLFW